jgi:hypothetical protein
VCTARISVAANTLRLRDIAPTGERSLTFGQQLSGYNPAIDTSAFTAIAGLAACGQVLNDQHGFVRQANEG